MAVTIQIILQALVAAILAQVVIGIIKFVVSVWRERQRCRDIPAPPGHWFWGNMDLIRFDEVGLETRRQLTIEYNTVMKLHLGPAVIGIILMHPDYIKEVTNTTEPKAECPYFFLHPWIGDGLLVSNGMKWQRNRHLLTAAFHFDILKQYLEIFANSSQVLLDKWEKRLENGAVSLEMFHDISLLTLDNLLQCTFGVDTGCQREGYSSPYINAVYDLSKLVIDRVMKPHLYSTAIYRLTPNYYKFKRACKTVHDFSSDIIKRRRREIQKGETVPRGKYKDFLNILIETKDEDGMGLTDAEIQDEVDTFMFAGHDTTASAMSWSLYHLARHPEHQSICRDEITNILGDNTSVSWNNLSELRYLTYCIKESLRLCPPVPETTRMLTRDITLPDGRVLYKGTWVTLAISMCHHNPIIWPNPETFDPLRFTTDNSAGRSSHAFLPFSAGPRNCIGQNFAMNELKVTLSTILRKYKLSLDETKPAKRVTELVLRAESGIWLKFEKL